jgi:hypothetical protein
MNNTCPECGLPIDNGVAFCGNCGHQLSNHPFYPDGSILPSYAYEQTVPEVDKSERLAIAGLIIAAVALASAIFIPLAALVLGLAGLIMATIARTRYRHAISLAAIFLSVAALLSGIGVWAYAVNNTPGLKLAEGKAVPSSRLVGINTPCYSVSIDSGLNNYHPSSCNFNAASSAEDLSVTAVMNPNITLANLDRTAPSIFKQALTSSSDGGNVAGQSGMGVFAGSPAYIEYVSNAVQNTRGIFAMVLNPSSRLDNVYIVGRVIKTVYVPTFGTLESDWQWK